MTGNAEATRPAAGESLEIRCRESDEPEQSHTDCGDARPAASNKVINTPCEVLFHDALKRARLSFETQSRPGGDRWEADIELHQARIVIEVTNSPGSTREKPRRDRKTAALTAAGYRVYWFSNHQARTNADGCVRQVVTENALVAETDPTFLVRTNRTVSQLEHNPNWGGGLTALTCEQCGSPFGAYRRSARPGARARFCSHRCYGDWLHEHPDDVPTKRLERDWSDLRQLYEAGMSARQLGEHYQCSPTAVRRAMRLQGIEFRPTGGHRPKGGFYQAQNAEQQ